MALSVSYRGKRSTLTQPLNSCFTEFRPIIKARTIHCHNLLVPHFATFCHTLVLKAWENHGKTMEKAWGKFHGFHGEITMLSMLAWNRKIVTVFPMKAWNIKPWKTMESMESIEYKTMENHGKHGNLQK